MHLPVMEKSPSSERRTCTDRREQVDMPASIIQGVCAAMRLFPVFPEYLYYGKQASILTRFSEVSMYAIVEVLGKQYRVQEGNKVVVDLMNAEKDSEVSLDRVLMIGGESTKIGTPVVEGAKVTAKVVDHILGDKVVVFKHKRRKAERRTQGHRQEYTVLTVTGIVA